MTDRSLLFRVRCIFWGKHSSRSAIICPRFNLKSKNIPAIQYLALSTSTSLILFARVSDRLLSCLSMTFSFVYHTFHNWNFLFCSQCSRIVDPDTQHPLPSFRAFQLVAVRISYFILPFIFRFSPFGRAFPQPTRFPLSLVNILSAPSPLLTSLPCQFQNEFQSTPLITPLVLTQTFRV